MDVVELFEILNLKKEYLNVFTRIYLANHCEFPYDGYPIENSMEFLFDFTKTGISVKILDDASIFN